MPCFFLFAQELYMANLFFCSLYTEDFTVSLTGLVSQCSFYMADGADKETVKSCFLVSWEYRKRSYVYFCVKVMYCYFKAV